MAASFSPVIFVPYGKREARHANAGFSDVGSFIFRDSARMSALVNPAARSGLTIPCSLAACLPGR